MTPHWSIRTRSIFLMFFHYQHTYISTIFFHLFSFVVCSTVYTLFLLFAIAISFFVFGSLLNIAAFDGLFHIYFVFNGTLRKLLALSFPFAVKLRNMNWILRYNGNASRYFSLGSLSHSRTKLYVHFFRCYRCCRCCCCCSSFIFQWVGNNHTTIRAQFFPSIENSIALKAIHLSASGHSSVCCEYIYFVVVVFLLLLLCFRRCSVTLSGSQLFGSRHSW